MEDKAAEINSNIVKVLLRVAGISFAVVFVGIGISLINQGVWGSTGDIILGTIIYVSMGLFLIAIIGYLVIPIIERLKTRQK